MCYYTKRSYLLCRWRSLTPLIHIFPVRTSTVCTLSMVYRFLIVYNTPFRYLQSFSTTWCFLLLFKGWLLLLPTFQRFLKLLSVYYTIKRCQIKAILPYFQPYIRTYRTRLRPCAPSQEACVYRYAFPISLPPQAGWRTSTYAACRF